LFMKGWGLKESIKAMKICLMDADHY